MCKIPWQKPLEQSGNEMKDRKVKQVLSGGGYQWEREGKWRG
jgi:hypothetical protein